MRQTGPPEEALPRVVAEVYRLIADPRVQAFAVGRSTDAVAAFSWLRQTVQPPPTQMVILYEAGPPDLVRTVERALRQRFRSDPRFRSLPALRDDPLRRGYQYVYVVLWEGSPPTPDMLRK